MLFCARLGTRTKAVPYYSIISTYDGPFTMIMYLFLDLIRNIFAHSCITSNFESRSREQHNSGQHLNCFRDYMHNSE